MHDWYYCHRKETWYCTKCVWEVTRLNPYEPSDGSVCYGHSQESPCKPGMGLNPRKDTFWNWILPAPDVMILWLAEKEDPDKWLPEGQEALHAARNRA